MSLTYSLDKVYRYEDHIQQTTELWRFLGSDGRVLHLMVYACRWDKEWIAWATDSDFEKPLGMSASHRWRAIRKQVESWERSICEHFGYA
jgi:hypothetical protein